MADSIFDVSRETLNAATFWINHVTGCQYIPVGVKLVTITKLRNSSKDLSNIFLLI